MVYNREVAAASATWLVLYEFDGSIVLKKGDSLEDATRMADNALKAKGENRASAVGVVKLDHDLRAAQVQNYRRAGHSALYHEAEPETEKAPMNARAYDALCSFGYDIERELASGNQPAPEKLIPFIQLLGIPVHVLKRVETGPPISERVIPKGVNPVYAVFGIAVLVIVLLMAFLLSKSR